MGKYNVEPLGGIIGYVAQTRYMVGISERVRLHGSKEALYYWEGGIGPQLMHT